MKVVPHIRRQLLHKIARDDKQLREISQLLIFVTENSANHINQPLSLGLWEGFKDTHKVKVYAI